MNTNKEDYNLVETGGHYRLIKTNPDNSTTEIKSYSKRQVEEIYNIEYFSDTNQFLIYYKDKYNNCYKLEEVNPKAQVKSEKSKFHFVSNVPLKELDKGIYFGKNTGINNHLTGVYTLIVKYKNEEEISKYNLNVYSKRDKINIKEVDAAWLDKNILDISHIVGEKDIFHTFIELDKNNSESIKSYHYFYRENEKSMERLSQELLDSKYPLNFLDAIINSNFYNEEAITKNDIKEIDNIKEKLEKKLKK